MLGHKQVLLWQLHGNYWQPQQIELCKTKNYVDACMETNAVTKNDEFVANFSQKYLPQLWMNIN